MQNDWTMNIKQNVMSHTGITHDKFTLKNSKWPPVGHLNIFFFFFEQTILNSGRAITGGCFHVRFGTTFSSYKKVFSWSCEGSSVHKY